MRIALYEPDIPQNTGTILRLAACLGVEAHIIEPAGFATSDRAFRRAGMDYLDQVTLCATSAGRRSRPGGKRNACGSSCSPPLPSFLTSITPIGRRMCCCSAASRRACRRPCIRRPMRGSHPHAAGLRSINVAMAAAMALGEAMRQTNGLRNE